MRMIERSSAFRRDYKRLVGGRYHSAVKDELPLILNALVNEQKLHPKHHDHELIGNWDGYRECHVKANLLLIYSLPDTGIVRLARLGTHSDLFG